MTGAILAAILSAATPLLLAATGELVAERAGVLNLGIEGMMLTGAVTGFAVARQTGSAAAGTLAAACAGTAMALVFAVLSLTLRANQTAAGLALTIFGRGLSALAGAGLVGVTAPVLPRFGFGALAFDPLAYAAPLALLVAGWFLSRTRAGLILRAVGDNHDAAHAAGLPVTRVRYAATAFGGAMAGFAGASVSLSNSPLWAQDITAGRGWIALALVVFAAWRPVRLLLGAWLFGGLLYLSLYAQAAGLALPSPLVSMTPYLGTILMLVLISRDERLMRLNRPAMLGRPFGPVS